MSNLEQQSWIFSRASVSLFFMCRSPHQLPFSILQAFPRRQGSRMWICVWPNVFSMNWTAYVNISTCVSLWDLYIHVWKGCCRASRLLWSPEAQPNCRLSYLGRGSGTQGSAFPLSKRSWQWLGCTYPASSHFPKARLDTCGGCCCWCCHSPTLLPTVLGEKCQSMLAKWGRTNADWCSLSRAQGAWSQKPSLPRERFSWRSPFLEARLCSQTWPLWWGLV